MSLDKFIFSIFMSLMSFCVCSQNNYKDVVHLKSGGIRKGIIVERIPGESLKIKTSDGSIFVFKMDNISKITKELIQEGNSENKKPKYNPSNNKPKSKRKSDNSFNQIEFGYDYGSLESYTIGGVQSPSNMGKIKLYFIRSYKFNHDISLGIGSGFRFYLSYEYLLLPLFTDFRIKFPRLKLFDSKVIPYAGFSTGVSFFFSGASLAGVLFNPIVGLHYDLSSKIKFNIGIGYDLQGWPNWYVYPYDKRVQIHTFAINAGITF